MITESEQKLPYEENNESFGNWFREAAKDQWQRYLNGNEKGMTVDEVYAMTKFLIEHGTQEEIYTRLGSLLDTKILAYGSLLKEIKTRRPDIRPPNFELDE
ncbi:MAG: hypothetical protein AAB871_00205 [Patescibacteria group bacterium]